MKKILVLFLALALAVFCSGCSKPAEDQSSSPADASSASEKQAASVVTPEPQVYSSGDYQYIILDDGTAEITKYLGSDTTVTIPNVLDSKTVTSIGEKAFLRSEMTRVKIPLSVKTIRYYAFGECRALKDITIPSGVTAIEGHAFACCDSVTGITIPDTVTDITGNPFTHCKNLREIVVSPEHPTLAVIDGVLFCKTDKRLVCYPYTLSESDYRIPDGIRVIGDMAFYYARCRTVSIPDSVISIGQLAFYTSSLESVTIPDSVTSIGSEAFRFCTISSVTIPDSVTGIGSNPFADCRNISIVVSADHPALFLRDGVLFSKPDNRLIYYPLSSDAESYTVPDGTQIIDDWAFVGSSLKNIILPDSVTRIGEGAFCRCSSLAEIRIPESVTCIGKNAFANSGSLNVIVVRDSYPAQYCVKEKVKHSYPDELDWLNN